VLYIKKSVLIIISIVASLSLISCSNQSKALSNNKQRTVHKDSYYSAKDVREAIWSQLPTVDKERIKGSWKDAKVSKIVLTKDSTIKDKSYIGKEVYLIAFPTTFIGKPNILAVFADVETYKFIGKPIIQ
jgi:uncharacterized lipoprotein NlpE involved in copper resistance